MALQAHLRLALCKQLRHAAALGHALVLHLLLERGERWNSEAGWAGEERAAGGIGGGGEQQPEQRWRLETIRPGQCAEQALQACLQRGWGAPNALAFEVLQQRLALLVILRSHSSGELSSPVCSPAQSLI